MLMYCTLCYFIILLLLLHSLAIIMRTVLNRFSRAQPAYATVNLYLGFQIYEQTNEVGH